MIELININKQYKNKSALKNINLTFQTGEFICIVGSSGGGKTTLMRMINRMNEPTSGQILIDGQDIQSVNEVQLRRKIGYVIQNIGLFPHMTIRENVMLVPKLLKWSEEEKQGIAEELIQKVELPLECLDQKPDSLSGGQQQRIGVIRALAANQEIILMDEPFGALDPITREALQNLIKKLQVEMGKTVIFVTHDMDEAIKLADRILIMNKGEVLQFASPSEIISKPANNFVKELIGKNKEQKQRLFQSQIKVKEIMNPHIKSVRLDKSVNEAMALMTENQIDSLMVVDNKGVVKGFLGLDDFDEELPQRTAVYEIMQKDYSRINENRELKDVILPLLEKKVDYLPVVDDDERLVGIITRGMLAKLLYQQLV